MTSSFYTRNGDDGYTGLLGKGRIAKEEARLEAIGTIDEATSALGICRNFATDTAIKEIILQVQRDLYAIMAEVAATPENAPRFRSIQASQVSWLEKQIDAISQETGYPKEFIVPGDCPAGAFLDLARTTVRRAERRLAGLLHAGNIENRELLRYLNRLSSLCYALELREIQLAGHHYPTLMKESES